VNGDLFAACVACVPSLTCLFFFFFFHQQQWPLFSIFSDLLTSDPGDNSNIYNLRL
jgi:hypothetical protein